jgi:hypothetical protein
MNQSALQQQLNAHHQAFANEIVNLSETDFSYATPGKWTAGQQLEHILRSVAPVKWAFSLPKFLLRLFFCKATRPSKNYDELVNKYQRALEFAAFRQQRALIAA